MADRPALDLVLLDAGGTLIRLDFEWMAEQLVELGAAVTVERVRRAEVSGRRRYDARLGGIEPREHANATGDGRAYFAGIIEGTGAAAEIVRAGADRFAARQADCGLWVRPMEGARQAIDGLKALGLSLAVVSNSDGRAEQHLRDCGVLDGIELVVDSHRVGVEKPDPRIFRIALERLAIPAERALFVGDIRALDEAGARAASVHFVLLDPYGDYAPVGVAAIPGIGELPAWIERHFETPAKRPISRGGGAP